MIDLESQSQATRLKKFGNSRAMLAIASFIIRYRGWQAREYNERTSATNPLARSCQTGTTCRAARTPLWRISVADSSSTWFQ
jgi:hypothetical protein